MKITSLMVEAETCCSCPQEDSPQHRRASERPRLAKFLSYVEHGGRGRAASSVRPRQRCPQCENNEANKGGTKDSSPPPAKRRGRRSSPEQENRKGARGRAARRCQSEAPTRARLREAARQKVSAESSEGQRSVYGYGKFTDHEPRLSPDLNNNKENESSGEQISLPPMPSKIYGKERVGRARSRRRTVAQVASGPYSLQGIHGGPSSEVAQGQPRGRSKSQRARPPAGPYSLGSAPYMAPTVPVLTPLSDSNVVTVTVGGPGTVQVSNNPLMRSRSKSRPRLSAAQLQLGTATIWPDRHGFWLPP